MQVAGEAEKLLRFYAGLRRPRRTPGSGRGDGVVRAGVRASFVKERDAGEEGKTRPQEGTLGNSACYLSARLGDELA